MSAAPETQQATRRHPFLDALEKRDHAALVAALAPDVVLHAAVTLTRFEGRDTVAEVYASGSALRIIGMTRRTWRLRLP